MGTTTSPPRWERVIGRFAGWVGGALLLVLMFHVTINALTRKLLNAPIYGTIELSQFVYLPIVATMGFVIAEVMDEHLRADLLFDRFPPQGRKWLGIGTLVLSVVLSALLTYFTLLEALEAAHLGRVAGETPFPSWPIYFALPLAFGFLMLIFAAKTVRAIKSDPIVDRELLDGDRQIEGAL